MVGDSEAERLLRTEDQLRSASGLAQAVLAPRAAELSQNTEAAKAALEEITSRSLFLERAYLVVPTARGWDVAGDTSSSVGTLMLPSPSQSKDLHRGKTIIRQGGAIKNEGGASAAFVPLIQNGRLLGVAGLVSQPLHQGYLGEIQAPVFRAGLILGATAILFGLIYLWTRVQPKNTRSHERLVAGLEAVVAVLVCWGAYHAIEEQA